MTIGDKGPFYNRNRKSYFRIRSQATQVAFQISVRHQFHDDQRWLSLRYHTEQADLGEHVKHLDKVVFSLIISVLKDILTHHMMAAKRFHD